MVFSDPELDSIVLLSTAVPCMSMGGEYRQTASVVGNQMALGTSRLWLFERRRHGACHGRGVTISATIFDRDSHDNCLG